MENKIPNSNLTHEQMNQVLYNTGNYNKHLESIFETQNELKESKSNLIKFSKPIISYEDNGIIFPNTINIIQGKAGVHKSRLAEMYCSALIKNGRCEHKHLKFKADQSKNITVCYVDTERNLKEQFPYSLQNILKKAGYGISENPTNFDYISLLKIKRNERFLVLQSYLEYLRDNFNNHTVIVLDVVTDCISDFNRADASMELIDLLNEAINKFDVTFIALIHENPGSSDKARGHLGTELMNKASTVLQVGFEKGSDNKPSDLIALNFLKTRSTYRYDSIYFRFCPIEKGLVLADEEFITDVVQSRQLKANYKDVKVFVEEFITEEIASSDLIELLKSEFGCSDKLGRQRLKELVQLNESLTNKEGLECHLTKEKKGKEMFYTLTPFN